MDLKELKGHCEFMSQNSDIRLSEEHKLIYKLINRYERLISFIKKLKNGYCWCSKGIGDPRLSDCLDICKEIKMFMKGVENE